RVAAAGRGGPGADDRADPPGGRARPPDARRRRRQGLLAASPLCTAGARNLTPEEIIEEVGSADLRDVFAAVLERGLVLRCHTEFSCRDLKMWMKPGEPELRWKTLNSNSKIKIPHLAHSLDLDKLLFVQKGKRSKAFMMSPKSNESKEDHCLSLLWKGGSLDLECENRTVREAMAKGFNLLIAGEPVL
ncbi:unnamed protein product, partial [Heterosigma akashiwo]